MCTKKVFVCLALFLVLLSGLAWSKEDPIICSICGKAITGQFYADNEGGFYCPKDFERIRPRCYLCGKKLSDDIKDLRGKPCCTACFNKTPEGKKQLEAAKRTPSVPSQTVVVQDRCTKCGKSLENDSSPSAAKGLCAKCVQGTTAVCVCCGQPLTRSNTKYFADGVVSCKKCAEGNYPPCSECSCPVNERTSPMLPNGGYVCPKHREGAVCDDSTADKLFAEARQLFTAVIGQDPVSGGVTRMTPSLCSLEELKQYGSYQRGERGLCQYSGSTHFVECRIRMLTGLSPRTFIYVAAHEMGHAWLAGHNPRHFLWKPKLSEGFAEWCAYKVMELRGDKEKQQQMLRRRGDAYGDGLKAFLRYEKEHGKEATLEYACTNIDI